MRRQRLGLWILMEQNLREMDLRLQWVLDRVRKRGQRGGICRISSDSYRWTSD